MHERTARCTYYATCGGEAPSDARDRLAFFRDRSAGHMDDYCADCGYTSAAHGRNDGTNPGSRHLPTHPFRPRTEGDLHDEYYNGCHGWD